VVETGRIGLRVAEFLGGPAGPQVISVTGGRTESNDYLELSATSQPFVERAAEGSCRATPGGGLRGTVGSVVCCVLLVSGLTDSAYLLSASPARKTYTIMQEREGRAWPMRFTTRCAQRLCPEVGYQIQGIRSSVVRGDHQDSRQYRRSIERWAISADPA